MDITQTMDPELKATYEHFPALPVPKNASDFAAFRKVSEEAVMAYGGVKNDHVVIEDRIGPHAPGAIDVPVRIYTPRSRTGLLPGLLWIHASGFTVGNPRQDDGLVTRIVEEVGCVVVSVDYRLAPEHTFPAATDDCYAALVWLATHAQEVGVKREHLAIAGQSAGGGICAAVGLMARDRGEVSLSFQMPLCACLDDRHITSSSQETTDARTWNRELSLKGWEAYLGKNREGDISPYAAPIRATNLAGLPPTYMMVGTLDLMRDENIEYANRLMQAGVPTELHVYPGAFHGFELLVANASISKRASDDYVSALKRALNPQ